ncbi:MAG: nicotinate phosphoribosyltransferase, partial [Candidatus Aquicultor sp.]
MFHTATAAEIKAGEITDVYFLRDVKILKEKQVEKHVAGEIRAAGFPDSWPWAVFAGIEELAHLFEGVNVDIDTLDEGTLFMPEHVVIN